MMSNKNKQKEKLKRKFFGDVEYSEDKHGHIVEIKASNGVFKINNPNIKSQTPIDIFCLNQNHIRGM